MTCNMMPELRASSFLLDSCDSVPDRVHQGPASNVMQLSAAGCLPHSTAMMTPAVATSGETSTCMDELSRLQMVATIIVIPAYEEHQ